MRQTWQEDVKAEIRRRATAGESPRDVKELAIAVGCAQSTMHDMLNNPEAKGSHLVPKVHEVLGWPAPPDPSAPEPEPSPPLPSPDALEMAAMFDRLPEEVRESIRNQAAAVLRLIGKEPG